MVTLIDGLSLGSIYALIALGYTMVYGIAKMLNFAHGDIIMVGAYSVAFSLLCSLNPILVVIVTIIVCIILGIVIEKVAYRPLRGASPLAVLITAIGVSNLLIGTSQMLFGPTYIATGKKYAPTGLISNFVGKENMPAGKVWEMPKIEFIENMGVATSTVITLISCVIIMVALTLFIKYTKTGKAMLAVSEDRGAATLMGVNVNKIITITFAIGSGLAACASLFYLVKFNKVEPTLGSVPGITAFTAAVIGGIGSIPGAMVGALLLGVIEQFCKSIPVISPYTVAVKFGLLILILLVKPTGLLGKVTREKV